MELRLSLFEFLKSQMFENKKIMVINADLAKCAGLGELYALFDDRTFNVGVAEQNMIGIAAGMSAYGYVPLIFSFAPFVTRRVCDQIAVSICYARLNVKVFGMDPGICAQTNGGTHMSFEDISCLRSFPNIMIFEPCDDIEFSKALPHIINLNTPVYTRFFRKEIPRIHDDNYEFSLYKADVVKNGEDITIFCSGITVFDSMQASIDLAKFDVNAEVINIHTIKPIDKDAIVESVRKTKRAIVVENHNVHGGLYSSICEVLAENYPVPVIPLAVKDEFGQVGDLDFLKQSYGIAKSDIVSCVLKFSKAYK